MDYSCQGPQAIINYINTNISMSKNQKDDFLKYGQGILLRGFKSEQQKSEIGFLTAKGFADTTAKYQTYKNILYFKNYRNAIFQIIPAGNFQINDELRKKLQISNQQTPNIKILKARAKSEEEQFNLLIKNKQKLPVCFGDIVIFKNVDSDTYLSGTIRPTKNGSSGAFLVEVTKNLSEILIYKVLPFRSYERIGMPIPFDSPVKLLNIFNNGYLTYEKIGIPASVKNKEFLNQKPITADKSYLIPVKTNSSESVIYECVTHFTDLSKQTEDPMPWQFVLHMVEVQNDSLIQHDIIYFEHTQNHGILSTAGKEIILKQMKNQTNEDLPFYECLWEIEKHTETEDSYILRHLMSGMTLGITLDSQGKPIKPELFDISEGEAEGNLGWVELKLAKKQKVQINSKSLINIASGQWFLDKVKESSSNEIEQQDDNRGEYISISRLNKLAANELQYETKKVKFTLQISKNCFIIKEIDNELKKQVLFALSFHSTIIELRETLKWGYEEAAKQERKDKVDYVRIMQVIDKIKEIKNFLKNATKQLSDVEFIKPIYKRQMICKDLGISQLLFELLFFMRENLGIGFIDKPQQKSSTDKKDGMESQQPSFIFKNKPKEFQKFMQLYNCIYEVIYELVRDNLAFKIYVSKWINFVITDVLTVNQPSHLNLLKELFKDNEFLVKNFVTDDLVQKIANRMIDEDKVKTGPGGVPIPIPKKRNNHEFVQKKYLQIFRLFCIVGKTINTSNQIKILNHFIKELKKNEIYSIALSKQDDYIFTTASIDKNKSKKRKFFDYYKICKEQYTSAWEYFVEYLHLAGDMTAGRNKTVQSVMEGYFTLDILADLFEKEQLHEAEAPIIRLLHNLHAESEKFYPIEKNKKISNFNSLKDEAIDVMTTTNPDNKPWNPPLRRVLDCLKKKLKAFGPIDPSQVLKNQNLFEILSFIWQTFNLGFWEKKEDVKDVLQHIMKILQPYPPILKNYAAFTIESKQNLLMMKCKLECMNIIQLVLDYDLDLSVRHMCKYFQVFQMPQKKRALINDEGARLLEYKIDDELANKFIRQIPHEPIELVQPTALDKMFELSKYNNPKLTSQSISIMERVLLKKKKAIEQFCQQIFVCDEERTQLKIFIEEKKNKFYTMQDQTLVNVTMSNQAGNYVYIYKQDNKDSGIMQDIFIMSEIIKSQYRMADLPGLKSLETSGMYKRLGTDKLVNFTDERTSSSIMKQSVLYAENIHFKALQFILNCAEVPTEELALKLLHLCYKFFVSLIWNFQDIKPTLIQYIPLISHHLKKNVGSIDFLKEMYDNNKAMLFNEGNVIKLIKQICNTIESENEASSFYKSKLLDFFRFLIYCNGKSLKFNQIQILKVMQDDSYKKIILNITKEQIQKLITRYTEDYQKLQKERKQNNVKIEPRLLYMITYFQILESLIDDKNSVNMGKLKKRFPFDTLVDWIRASKNCWPLKRNIRAFLNRLYYFEPEVEIYMKTIIGLELDNIINDLNQFIIIKSRPTSVEFEAYIFENPVRFSYLESYLYLNLEENLFTLYQLTTRKNIQEEMKTILHPIEIDNNSNVGPYNFIRICERLGWIKNYFADKKNVFTNSFIKFLLNKFKLIIDEFDDNIYLPGMNITSGLGRAPTKQEKEKARVGLIEKIMNGDIGTFFVQGTGEYDELKPLVYSVPDKISNPKDDKKPNQGKLLAKLREILKREKRQFKSTDQQVSYKLNRLVRAIKLSSEGEQFLIKQYNNKLSNYSKLPQTFDYISIIIQMNSRNPQALPIKQKKFFLNLITGIVDQNNKVERTTKPIDQWDPQDWYNSKDDLIAIQNKLKLCDLGKFITQLLKQNIWDNIEFADSILLCGIAYLFGGNTATQKNMIEEISADQENRVMRNIEGLITKLGKFILKNIEESKQVAEDLSKSFSPTTIDNYDFYEGAKKYVQRKNVFEPQTTDEQIYSKTCVRTYRRAFKFLQLLCENNNVEGKNFIREQPQALKSFDFIEIASKEIRSLFLSLNTEICGVTMFLLDFVLEVTQIPVKANQQSLMKFSFFQDVCALQKTFSQPDILSQKGFDGKEYEYIENIYFKAIQIILSNFEGNEQKTFRTLDSKLQPQFLTKILTEKLSALNLHTKENIIDYIYNLKECVFDDNMMAILNIIIIFKKIKDKLGDSSRIYFMYDKLRSENLGLYQFLENCLLEIEIVNAGNNQTVIFPKYPVFSSLSDNLRDAVMEKVQRITHRDKIVSLLSYTSFIKNKIQSSYSLLKVQGIAQSHMNDAFRISAIMSIVLCMYMIMFYDVIINYGDADFSANRIIGLGRMALSLIQLSMSLVYGYYWLMFKIWQKPEKLVVQSSNKNPSDETADQRNIYIKKIEVFLKKIATKLKIDVIIELFLKGLRGGDTSQPLYSTAQFYRVIVYVLVAFFGTFFHPALFFLHIMDIFCYIEEIGDIFKAIGMNIKELGYVSFMGVIFTFVFCTVTFSNYQKNVYSGDENPEEMCQEMLDCIFQLFVSGAIGETMEQFEFVRFTYDMIYGIFFGILFSSIISGIMLDSFAQLREVNESLAHDKQNYCYICNISREALQKKRISFQTHINGKHFLWNYVFYIYFLNKKSETDYTGLEYQITTQYNKSEEQMSIEWIPSGQPQEFDCKAKLQEISDQIGSNNKLLDESKSEIDRMVKQFKEIAGNNQE